MKRALGALSNWDTYCNATNALGMKDDDILVEAEDYWVCLHTALRCLESVGQGSYGRPLMIDWHIAFQVRCNMEFWVFTFQTWRVLVALGYDFHDYGRWCLIVFGRHWTSYKSLVWGLESRKSTLFGVYMIEWRYPCALFLPCFTQSSPDRGIGAIRCGIPVSPPTCSGTISYCIWNFLPTSYFFFFFFFGMRLLLRLSVGACKSNWRRECVSRKRFFLLSMKIERGLGVYVG